MAYSPSSAGQGALRTGPMQSWGRAAGHNRRCDLSNGYRDGNILERAVRVMLMSHLKIPSKITRSIELQFVK